MGRLSVILFLGSLLVLVSLNCVRKDMEDQKFQQLAEEFLEGFYQAHPVWATYIGMHKYDDMIDDYSLQAIQAEIMRLRFMADKMKSVDTLKLSVTNKVDYKILENEINSQLLGYEESKPYENSPLIYTRLIGGAINSLINREFAPLSDRLRSVMWRLKRISFLVRQARTNLKNPPEIRTRTAIKQNKGNINLIKNDLAKVLERLPAMKDSLARPIEMAIKALTGFQEFLENDLLARSTGDFRLGKKLFEKKLRLTLQSDLPPGEIIRRAEAEIISVRKRMFELAQPLHQKMFPGRQLKLTGRELENMVIKQVMDEIAKDHPQEDELLAVCRQNLKEQEEFVR
jgi:uncharacterized protein (DUF885 family)